MSLTKHVMPSEKKHKDTIKINEKLQKVNKNLPLMPFYSLIQGTVGSGKTSLLYSLLCNYQKINYFDVIYFYNRVSDSDEVWESFEKIKVKKVKGQKKEVPITVVQIFNDYDNDQLKKLIDNINEVQKERKEEGKRPLNILFVFDDMAYSGITKKASAPSSLDQLIINRRHYNASLIITSQTYKALSQNARSNNLTHLMLMRANKTDLELIAEDHCGEIEVVDFINAYKHVKKNGKYDFFLVDYADDIENRFKKDLDVVIKIE